MRFWIREIMGWLLVLGGLYGFFICLSFLVSENAKIFEAAIFCVPSIFIFRGGIHLLKVSIAARLATQTETRIARPTVETAKPRKFDTQWDW